MLPNKFLFVSICIIICTSISCKKAKKNVNDYYPEVETVSAIIQADGSVEVTAKILNKGTTDIEYAGFCMDTLGVPGMLSNQILSSSISDDLFTATYIGLAEYKSYFFRAWAANDVGYSYGNTIRLDSLEVVSITPPCTPTQNTINIGSPTPTETIYNVSTPTQNLSEWEFSANSSSIIVNFTFGSKLATKIYTVSSSNPGSDNVSASIYSGFTQGSLKPGEKVYVNQISPTRWNITLCAVAWQSNSSTRYITATFECPN